MKKIFILLIVVLCMVSLVACDYDSVARDEQQYTNALMEQMNDEVGQPNITEFYEKKLAKEIFEKRDDSDLICYVYNQNIEGQYVYVGKSMGYGLPYSTQYTNPDNPYWRDTTYYQDYPISQPEPNGLYTAEGLSATWLMMIDETTGETYIMYAEPTIVVTESKLPERLIVDWSLEGVDY